MTRCGWKECWRPMPQYNINITSMFNQTGPALIQWCCIYGSILKQLWNAFLLSGWTLQQILIKYGDKSILIHSSYIYVGWMKSQFSDQHKSSDFVTKSTLVWICVLMRITVFSLRKFWVRTLKVSAENASKWKRAQHYHASKYHFCLLGYTPSQVRWYLKVRFLWWYNLAALSSFLFFPWICKLFSLCQSANHQSCQRWMEHWKNGRMEPRILWSRRTTLPLWKIPLLLKYPEALVEP